jgi:tetratricopeptide (TPR) repeat protein
LRIAARSSSIAATQESTDAKSMAKRLGVANLLEGNMRRQGNILRVSVQLIDGVSGLAIWSDTFDRGARELLNVQQEIAEAVVREVLPGSDRVAAEPATRDATANEMMLLARHYEQQVREQEDVDVETLQRAIQLYRDATEADPESALAHSRLAGALMYLGDIDGAEAPAFKALSLNPRLAEVQNTLGKFLFARGRPNMGEPLARAVELNPNLPDALHDYAHWYWFNVSTNGVSELYQRALDLDPLNVSRYAALGVFLALNDRPAEARYVVQRMTEIFDGASAYRAIAKVLDILGDVDHAIAWTIKARDAEPDNPLHVEKLAEYYTDIGDHETAFALWPDIGVGLLLKMRRYDEMIDQAEILTLDYPEDIQLRVYLAIAYNAVGNHEAAIRTISRSGLLDSFANGRRSTEEQDGLRALLSAAYASGEIEQAEEIAEWSFNTHYEADTADWWVALGVACKEAILGQDDEVYRRLKRAQEGKHLAWEPLLKDAPCFKRFAEDPVFQATVRHYDELREMLRARLPSTLAQYGVSLR